MSVFYLQLPIGLFLWQVGWFSRWRCLHSAATTLRNGPWTHGKVENRTDCTDLSHPPHTCYMLWLTCRHSSYVHSKVNIILKVDFSLNRLLNNSNNSKLITNQNYSIQENIKLCFLNVIVNPTAQCLLGMCETLDWVLWKTDKCIINV